ncbi:MAG: DUF177 domain-containing protein [Proteobacteria bacterium]|nr:DUF177 domain-containing protein [Pseudomonadota bacterium]
MTNEHVEPEFSRPIKLESLGEEGRVFTIDASPGECAALARRFALAGLNALSARVELGWIHQGRRILRLRGRLTARATQTCVVTLAPVAAEIDEEFDVDYAEPDASGGEIVLDMTAEEGAAEPLPDGVLDIGEAVAQQLALSLDPYPRSAGASLAGPPDAVVGPPASPFAVLRKLRPGEPPGRT